MSEDSVKVLAQGLGQTLSRMVNGGAGGCACTPVQLPVMDVFVTKARTHARHASEEKMGMKKAIIKMDGPTTTIVDPTGSCTQCCYMTRPCS